MIGPGSGSAPHAEMPAGARGNSRAVATSVPPTRVAPSPFAAACISLVAVAVAAGGGCASTLPGPPDGGREITVEASALAMPFVTDEGGIETGAE